MKLEQTLEIYSPLQMQRVNSERQRVYTVVDLESLSASALYTGDNSFVNSAKLSIGPGIARKMPEAGDIIERVRKDSDTPPHLNYEYLVPGEKTKKGKQKYIVLSNIHIPLLD